MDAGLIGLRCYKCREVSTDMKPAPGPSALGELYSCMDEVACRTRMKWIAKWRREAERKQQK